MTVQDKTKDLKGTFAKILEEPGPYADEDEKATCRRLVEALPDDLVDYAANTSYAYWYLACQPDSCPSEETKIQTAMREARRHYVYMGRDYDKAFSNFSDSCQYRKDNDIDLLRVCFNKASSPIEFDERTERRIEEMEAHVESDLKKQIVIMRGHDRESHAMMIKFARVDSGTTEETYVLSQIYMADRSTAATEFLSMGKQERSCAVYDYNGFESKNSPPFQAQVSAATQLQKLFPERLQSLVMVEPPLWLRSAMALLSPFLSASITDRVKMASGVEEKTKTFSEFMDPEFSTPLLLPDGKLDSPVSLPHFLEDVPYYCLYDDVKCEREVEVPEMNGKASPVEGESTISAIWKSMF